MNPDVAAAVERLAAAGTLTKDQARLFGRVARRELVSVHGELRVLLYAGVLTTMAGVGLLVEENLDRIGPLAIAVALGLAALACLVWVALHAQPFTWGETRASHPALDYLLLFGVLLLGADLAYVEAKFTPLGEAWPWHLLLMSALMAVLAARYDSRVVFSLALSTFAAWRGVSSGFLGEALLWQRADALRANAIVCGLVFLFIGWLAARTDRKAHFEPVASYSGWLLVFAALVSGLDTDTSEGLGCGSSLFVLGSAVAALALWRGRFPLFAIGLLAAYCGLTALALHLLGPGPQDVLMLFWFFLSPIAILAALLFARRRMGERE